MEFQKDLEHCTGDFLTICSWSFVQENVLKTTSWRKTCMLKCSTCFCWNLFLHNRWMFDSSKKSVSTVEKHVYNPFIGFVSVAPLVTWGWHGIFIAVKRGTPLLHLVSRVKLCQKFCYMGGTVSSICWFGSCKLNFHAGILGIQTTN